MLAWGCRLSSGGTSGGSPLVDSSSDTVEAVDSDAPLDARDSEESAPDTKLPLDDLCSRVADAICSKTTEICCSAAGILYDEAQCKKNELADCVPDVLDVKAGKKTFDATKIEACLAGLKALSIECTMTLLPYVKALAPCYQIFPGTTPPGGSCTREQDCATPPGAIPICRGTPAQCEIVAVIEKGGVCAPAPSTTRYCDDGLACTGGFCGPLSGKCSSPSDDACGFGFSCRAATCAEGLAEGLDCKSNYECASWKCSADRCTDPRVKFVGSKLCGAT